jgi:uncharacterized protein
MSDDFEKLFNFILNLEIIDTHEHLPHRESARKLKTDILKEYCNDYFGKDLISAGLPVKDLNKILDSKENIISRWDLVEPYWENSRHTGYGQCMDISVKGLYGIEKICRTTIEELNEKFLISLKGGQYEKVLKDKSNIKVALLDNIDNKENYLECDKKYFRCVHCMDYFIFPQSFDTVRWIEEFTDVKITSFKDWLTACEIVFEKGEKKGAVALKSRMAYIRPLSFKRVSYKDAEEEFNQTIFSNKHFRTWLNNSFTMGNRFQDFMMHYLLNMANKKNMTFQFHTGFHDGNGNYINNGDPSLLANLFIEYEDVKFDIFHISYPFQHLLPALAKNFKNVYINMCWAPIISPTAARNALIEFLDTVPVNKICAFGGDFAFIDGVYGHRYLSSKTISQALVSRIKEGVFDFDRAKEIAEIIFYNNPVKLYNLEFLCQETNHVYTE